MLLSADCIQMTACADKQAAIGRRRRRFLRRECVGRSVCRYLDREDFGRRVSESEMTQHEDWKRVDNSRLDMSIKQTMAVGDSVRSEKRVFRKQK